MRASSSEVMWGGSRARSASGSARYHLRCRSGNSCHACGIKPPVRTSGNCKVSLTAETGWISASIQKLVCLRMRFRC